MAVGANRHRTLGNNGPVRDTPTCQILTMLLSGWDPNWTPRPPVLAFSVSDNGRLSESAPRYVPQSKGRRPKKAVPELEWAPKEP